MSPARRWRAFGILWFAMFVIGAGLGMVVPILPVFVRDLGASGIWLGLAFSGFAVTQTPMTPIVGRLGDKFGRRPFIIFGLIIYVIVGVGFAAATNYYEVAFYRMVMGMGAACMFPSAFGTVGSLAPEGQEGRYMGLFMVSFTAGFGIGPMIGGILADAFGRDITFISLAGSALIAIILVATLMPRSAMSQRPTIQASGSLKSMLKDPHVLALFTFNIGFGFSIGCVMTFIAIFMTDALGASATIVGVVVGSRAIESSFLQPAFGRLADSIARDKMIIVGGIFLAVGTAALPIAPTVPLFLAIFLFLGLAESIAMPASMAITTDLGRHYGLGTLIGLNNSILVLGLLVGSLGGSVIETIIGMDNMFRTMGLGVIVVIVLFVLIWNNASKQAYSPRSV